MTLGDIKLEALRLMYVNGDSDIRAEDLKDLADTQSYGVYLINMWGAVNRCFCDLENKGVLPSKMLRLIRNDGTACTFGKNICFVPSELVTDFLAVDRLVYENSSGEYIPDAPYRAEGESLIIPAFDGEHEEYRLYYHPRLTRIFPYTPDSTELDIPEHIASYIPYFIKGELYGGADEPADAAEAHNIYENGVMSAMRSVSREIYIHDRYSL